MHRLFSKALALWAVGVFVFWTLPESACAQSVLVEVVAEEYPSPIQGAFVTLLTPSGEPVRSSLTNTDGRFLFLTTNPGTYRIRVEMMGRETHTSPDLWVGPDRNLIHRVSLAEKAITLEGFEVNGERICRVRPFEATTTATVWEEARKALAVTAWGDREGAFRYRIERHVRDLDRDASAIESEGRRSNTAYYHTPFESRPAAVLANQGFVEESPDGDLYFAPDAEVLLSDEFLDTHCMGLIPAPDSATGMVGVVFEPIPGRRVPDIRGTFWVDAESGALRRLDFSYANLEPSIQDERIGGRVEFRRLPAGHWIVRNWWIRMPMVSMVYRGSPTREPILTGFREEGGEVISVHDGRGSLVLEALRGTIAGILTDEDTGQPVPRTEVFIAGVGRSGATSEDGTFRFSGLAEGTYQLQPNLPMAATLGLEPGPTLAEAVPGEVTFVELLVPSTESMVRRTCLEAVGSDTAVAVVGQVRDAETGEPISNALVQVWWSDWRFSADNVVPRIPANGRATGEWWATWGENRRGVETWSSDGGEFAVCGPKPDHPLTIHANHGPFSSDTTELRIPIGETVLEQNLAVHTDGIGVLTGLVVDFQTKTALPSARITMAGSDEIRMSDENGMFSFPELPVGGHSMRVELLGYATLEDSVIVGPGQNIQVEVQLPSAAFELEPMVVEVMRGTLAAARGLGRSVNDVTRADLEVLEAQVADLAGVIRRTMGNQLRISTPTSAAGMSTEYCVQAKRRANPHQPGCQPVMLIVDGVPVFAPSADASAIEQNPTGQFREILSLPPIRIEDAHFLSPMEGRYQYGPQGHYGVLVINTRDLPAVEDG